MNLDEYLKKHRHSLELRNLIKIIESQIPLIKKEFLRGDEKTGKYNIYGEEEARLDEKANEVWIRALSHSELVAQIATEEEKEIIKIKSKKANFGVTIDPLDGSSLLPTNLAVGSIFSIYENGEIMSGLKNISSAFYILFGPLTLMVFADKTEVSQFIYNEKGIFDLVKENIKIPEGKLYSPGGLRKDWLPAHLKIIEEIERRGFKLRYSGSFVADFHQILVYGGIFTYPALVNAPQGKLRLLFEVGPMAFIAEKAGGAAIDGKNNILELIPKEISQRSPIYIGSKKVIEEILSMA